MIFIKQTCLILFFIFIVSSKGEKQEKDVDQTTSGSGHPPPKKVDDKENTIKIDHIDKENTIKIDHIDKKNTIKIDDIDKAKQKKQMLVLRAKISQEIGRFGTMAKAIKEAVEMCVKYGLQMDFDDQYLMEFAYKIIADARRSALGHIYSIMQNHQGFSLETIKEMKEEIEMEIKIICEDVLRLTELIQTIEKNDPVTKVFFYSMKGDYHRYLAEVKRGQELDDEARKALVAYDQAYKKAKEIYQATDPIRISIVLKTSVLYYDTFNEPELAYEISNEAVTEAEKTKPEDMTEEARQSLNLLKENMNLIYRRSIPGTQGTQGTSKKEGPTN